MKIESLKTEIISSLESTISSLFQKELNTMKDTWEKLIQNSYSNYIYQIDNLTKEIENNDEIINKLSATLNNRNNNFLLKDLAHTLNNNNLLPEIAPSNYNENILPHLIRNSHLPLISCMQQEIPSIPYHRLPIYLKKILIARNLSEELLSQKYSETAYLKK